MYRKNNNNNASFSLIGAQGTLDPLLLLVFLSYIPKIPEGFPRRVNQVVPRTLGQQLAPKSPWPWALLFLPSMVVAATWPSLACWTKDEPQEFLIITFKRVFLKIAVTARGRGRRFYSFPQFILNLCNYCFSQIFSLAVDVSLASHPQSLSTPKLPARRGSLPSQSFSWLSFKISPTNRILAGKEAWLRNVKYGFINKVLPCDEVATLAKRDAQNLDMDESNLPVLTRCSAPITVTLWFQ